MGDKRLTPDRAGRFWQMDTTAQAAGPAFTIPAIGRRNPPGCPRSEFIPMRRVTPAIALLALAALPVAARAGLWELIRGYRELEVITVTDVAGKGALLPPADPAHPQYYVASSLGYRELGAYRAGTTEPPNKDVIHLISAELAKQGYFPSTAQSAPPSLLLVYAWGTLNAEKFYGADPSFPPQQLNKGQIVRFLGGHKVGIRREDFGPLAELGGGLQRYNFQASNILDVASEDFYVIVVSAYDLEAALKKKHQPPLWITRIAAPSLGFDLGAVLPAMLAIGGQQFGRDTPQPVWINASDKFKPNVRMGEIQLLEYLNKEPLPVIDSSDVVAPKELK